MHLVVHPLLNADGCSFTYILVNPASQRCAIVDPVLDYDPERDHVTTTGADRIIEFVTANALIVEWILETRLHTRHLSAARYLKSAFVCAQMGIGSRVCETTAQLAEHLNLAVPLIRHSYDRLFEDQARICIGHACGRVLHVPGAAADAVAYVFDGVALVGDLLAGSGEADSERHAALRAERQLLSLPDDTRVFVHRDASGSAQQLRCLVTVASLRQSGVMSRQHSHGSATPSAARSNRDQQMFGPAVHANLSGGVLPGWRMQMLQSA
jgi:glyoxylase-like metal-dependent hydrolase (beta-lactamase superfamily II)